jgi:hypothetical protein
MGVSKGLEDFFYSTQNNFHVPGQVPSGVIPGKAYTYIHTYIVMANA